MISIGGVFFRQIGWSALVRLLDHKEHDGATELKIVLDILIQV